MRIIRIKCLNNGKSEITNDSFHFSEENKASKVIVDFSEITNRDFYKFLDVEAADGTKDRKDFGLSKAEVVEVELTNEFTKGGYLTFSPFVTDSLSVDALKEKFAPQKITIRKTLDVSEGLTEPSGDVWFEFVASYLQKLEKKLDKQIVIDNQTIDVLATLLAKADFSEIQKLYKGHEYDPNTGIITFIAYDDTRSYLDLPMELIVSSGIYDEETYELVLVLANDDELRIPIGHVLTEMTQEINAIKTRIDNIVEGKTPVAKANVALSLETAEKLEVSDVFKVRVTALNNNEIKDKTVAEIREVANINAFQLIENASELEEFTTETPIDYIEGNPTTVVDGQLVVSKPKLIISKSNNLFDVNELNDRLAPINVVDNKVIISNAYSNTINNFPLVNRLKPNTYYTFTRTINKYIGNSTGQIRLVNPKNSAVLIIANHGSGSISYTFTTPSDIVDYTTLVVYGDASTIIEFTNITLNEGTTALPYQPYAEHTYSLGEGVELPKLPNGVGDRWLSDGTVEKKVRKIIVDTNKLTAYPLNSDYTNIDYFLFSKVERGSLLKAISNKFINSDEDTNWDTLDKIGKFFYKFSTVAFAFAFPKGTTLEQAKALLIGTEIHYQLATPTIENAEPLPTYIDTYTQGTIIVDNGQSQSAGIINVGRLYVQNCVKDKEYFISCRITNKTNLKLTNGTHVVSLPNGYAKFKADSSSNYWLEYVKDGINKISKVQLFDITEMGLTSKTADDLNQVLGTKFYPFGSTEETPTIFIASGDNWLKPGETFHNVVPGLNYKYVGSSNVLTKFYTAEKVEISSTNALEFTTPLNCFFISYDTEDLEVALYHGDNPETKYLKYTEKEVDLTKGVQEYIAYNYGREMLDKLGFLRVAYYKDVVKQSETNTANIEDILTRLAALEG